MIIKGMELNLKSIDSTMKVDTGWDHSTIGQICIKLVLQVISKPGIKLLCNRYTHKLLYDFFKKS